MMRVLVAIVLSLFPVATPASNNLVAGLPEAAVRNASIEEAQGETAQSGDLDRIRRDSQSHVTLQLSSGPDEVYLYAKNQTVDTIRALYCGGSPGDKEYHGRFALISVRNGKVASQLQLDPETFFVTGRPHDGLHVFTLSAHGQALLNLYQYENCNNESLEFYRLDPQGRLARVRFLRKDGGQFPSEEGAIYSSGEAGSIFCSYHPSASPSVFCDAYRYDGKDFVQTKSWMGNDLRDAWQHPTPTDQAERSLYDFLSDLASKDYQTAAFYYAGPLSSAVKTAPASPNRAKCLDDYCRTAATGCPDPQDLSKLSTAAANGELEFLVSFEDAHLNGRRFRFWVGNFGSGFKVLDLPPLTAPAKRTGKRVPASTGVVFP
jgi:hypothetical protein